MPVKVLCSFPAQRSFPPLTFNVGMVRGPLEGGYGSVRFIGSETQISQEVNQISYVQIQLIFGKCKYGVKRSIFQIDLTIYVELQDQWNGPLLFS